MTDPIRIPLSTHQQALFAGFKAQGAQLDAQVTALNARLSAAVESLIAGVVDPKTIQDWSIQYDGPEIVCAPPLPAKPALVPDIGPDGVSEAAATA